MNAVFNGTQLQLARFFNGLSLEAVGNRVGKTRQYINQLEVGQASPTDQLLEQLADALGVMPGFLCDLRSSTLSEEQFHFRKLLGTRSAIKQAVLARGELTKRLVFYLDQHLKLPDLRIPDISEMKEPDDIEQAAEQCRREWGLGLGPISNMSRLAESVGTVITSFSSVSKDIDALSVNVQRPIIVRNEAKESVCRQRFDIAHELGHFVMHQGIVTGDRLTESQANHFASALLLPRSMIVSYFPRLRGSRLNWQGLAEFKQTWKVSLKAILYRAHQLEIISPTHFKSGMISLNRLGNARKEQGDELIAPEPPELLARSLNVLAEKKSIYAEDIAKVLQVTPEFLKELIGFDLPIKKPHLYLVHS